MPRRFLLPLLMVTALYGQTMLPRFAGETLTDRKLTLPDAVHGHEALLIVGFTHASGPNCTAWAKRLESEFGNNTDLERYTVVFLEDAPRLVRGMAKSGIKRGVPPADYNNYVIVTEHEKDLKAAVHFAAPDDAYLVLLGSDGAIRWTFHGPVGDEPLKQVRALMPK